MVRLLRLVPQLLILVKAIGAALVTVSLTLALLVAVLYVSAIAFCQLTAKSELGERKFGKIHNAMNTLFLAGALLDDITGMVVEFSEAEDYLSLVMFYVFVLFAAITIMNMLIGVVCEVISATAAAEKEGIQVACVKDALQGVLLEEKILDEAEMHDGEITKTQFFQLLHNRDAIHALDEVGVDATMLVDFADVIFPEGERADESKSLFDAEEEDPEEKKIKFSDLMHVVLQLRGSNTATVKDIINLQKHLKHTVKTMLKQMVEDLAKGQSPQGSRVMRQEMSEVMPQQSSEDRNDTAGQSVGQETTGLSARLMGPKLPRKQVRLMPCCQAEQPDVEVS